MGIPEYSLFVSYKIYTALIVLCLSVCLAVIHPLRQIQRIFLGFAHGFLGNAIFCATVKRTRIIYCQWLPVSSTRFEVPVATPQIISSSLFSSLSHLLSPLSLWLYIQMLKTPEINRIVGRYHINTILSTEQSLTKKTMHFLFSKPIFVLFPDLMNPEHLVSQIFEVRILGSSFLLHYCSQKR